MEPALPPPRPEPRWKVYGCFALLLVALHFVVGPRISLPRWHVERGNNAAVDEAVQWKLGTLAHSKPYYESPQHDGKSYNIFGLAFVLLSVMGTTLSGWAGAPPDEFYGPYYALFVAGPIPVLAYWAFRRSGCTAAWAAVMSGYLIAGTSLFPILWMCQGGETGGSVYYINHALATSGLLLMAGDLLGSRRIWPALIGLALAAWSRQFTSMYAIPILWIAWRDRVPKLFHSHLVEVSHQRLALGGHAETETPTRISHVGGIPARRGRMALALLGVLVVAAVPMTLNHLRWGNPFDTGYSRVYGNRTDPIATRGRRALFSHEYIPMHAKSMNTAYPRWEIRKGTLYADTFEINGASIWLTSPILLGIFFTFRDWWRDERRRALMLATIPVVAGVMCYHATGSDNAGYYRYSLDFIPIWMVVIAPFLCGPRGAPLTLACLAYSALYFSLMP